MPYYGDGAPYYLGSSPYANHSSLLTGVNRYFNPIAARYSPHLSTISETPLISRRRHVPSSVTTSSTASFPRPRRIIDTADIDVSKPPRSLAQDSRPHRLRRDRPTIKIRSQALKDNPALREYNEKHEKTVGELLVEKFLIKDKQNDDGEGKMRLYHQASLASNGGSTCTNQPSSSSLSKEREDEILAAIRRRVTRRMTRRRSSADVIPLDPEQIKREAALQAAQAEALDTLVAQEQAEIEVEVKRGTFSKRLAMRLPTELSEASATEGEDEDVDEDSRRDRKLKKHVVKKKKRKKIEVLPFVRCDVENEIDDEEDDDEDTLEIPESVIEEEEEEQLEQEFQWDDREKCDDIEQFMICQNGDVAKTLENRVTAAKLNGSMTRRIVKDLDRVDAKKQVKIEDEEELENKVMVDQRHTPSIEEIERLKPGKRIRVGQRTPITLREDIKSKVFTQNCEISELQPLEQDKIDQAKQDNRERKRNKNDEANQTRANEDRKKGSKINENNSKVGIQKIKKYSESKKSKVTTTVGNKLVKSENDNDGSSTQEIGMQTSLNLSEHGVKADQLDLKNDPTPRKELDSLSRTESDLNSNMASSRFKIEACNSVGDFSTLYVKSSNSLAEESIRSIEQFRESVRLPAPRREAPSSIETEVLLPVRKPYICDTSRNSVYLAVKQSQIGSDSNKSNDDESTNNEPSIITNDMRKQSECITEAIAPTLAKTDDSVENRSIIEGDLAATEERHVSLAIDYATATNLIAAEFNRSGNSELVDQGAEHAISESLDGEVKSSSVGQIEISEARWDETEGTSDVKKSECLGSGVLDQSEEVISNVRIGVVCLENSEDAKKRVQQNIRAEPSKKLIKLSEKTLDTAKVCSFTAIPDEERNLISASSQSEAIVKKSKSSLEESSCKTGVSQKSVPSRIPLTPLSDKVNSISVIVDKEVEGDSEAGPPKSTNDRVKGAIEVTRIESEKSFQLEKDAKPHGEQNKASNPPKILSKIEKPGIPDPCKKQSADRTQTDKKEELAKQEKVSNQTQSGKKKPSKDSAKIRHELLKIDHRHLPKIPEEPKTASPLEKRNFELPTALRKPNESAHKSASHKTGDDANTLAKPSAKALSIEPVTSGQVAKVVAKKDRDEVKKKRVDAEAVMKIEKKILEDAESPCKIVSSAMPVEPLALEESAKKDEQELLAPTGQQKVGLQPSAADTKKKSAEPIAAAGHRVASEIDFWSEIKAAVGQEGARVSGAPDKAQSASDLDTEESPCEVAQAPASSPLKLDLSKTDFGSQDEQKTPLVPDDQSTPLVQDSPALESFRRRENSLVSCHSLDDDFERTGTVKKISKWSNLNNLAEIDEATTPLASNEPSPVVSAASSTVTKKKVVKRKKSTATQGKKKPSEKGESTKKKTQTSKKSAASPQTSILRGPTSASGRNSPAQRPADLTKMFYTTPAILLTATPRDLRKVRRAKVKRKKPATRTPSLSSDSTGSTRSTATNSNSDASNAEEDLEHKRLASTRSNDSGFDGSPRLSTPSQSSENQHNAESEHCHHSGRITPPATNLPRFKKYEVLDFNFLKVLGKGSFGKVLLAELRGTECVYAVKCLKKDVVLEDDDVECTLIERKVLTLATRHPYLCHLFCTFQTESHLFFVMEYLNGGDLMFHIQKSGRFSETRAKFYAAEIWSGLIFLHKKGIVYRDLKLDNVLLDFEGHIRIADFGMCKLQIFLDRTADTFCGTPDYMAPEIIKGLKYNQAVDWWSFGVLLYEMLTGQSPFSGCDEDELFWSICNERPFIPRYLGQSATELLVALLEKDSGKRIPGHEIACHAFFCNIAWDKLERRQLEAPFKPAVEHTLDTRYFDTAFTTERPRLTLVPEHILSSMDQAVFRGFSYTNPNATD